MHARFSIFLLLTAAACGSKTEQVADQEAADTLATPALADTTDPLPFMDLASAKILKLTEPWNGDYDSLGDRRFIRALVPFSRTLYYLDRGVQKGVAFEALREFEKQLPPLANGVRPKVVIIPTRRDRIGPGLLGGYGDIAIGGFTVTAERSKLVDFSIPTIKGVHDVVVTRAGTPSIRSEDDLAGREVHVRPSSIFEEDLMLLNTRLKARGKPPVVIRPTDGALEDEDILQMVSAGLIPATVTLLPYAKFWSQLYDSLVVNEAVPLRTDGELAWALRKNTPVLLGLVNQFVKTHGAGTTFGNVMLKRYLGSVERLKNPAADAERQKLQAIAGYFQTYGERYDLPWLLVAAQAYQESQFDQSRRSSVGAVGVMQIKPETAADRNVRISGIEQVEPNIHAGIKYLRFVVDRYFADSSIDRLNKGLFALAAYNAGPGRVRQLRTKAAAAGLDPNVWFGNVEVIAAREIGRETVDYVSNIYKYYTVYRSVMAARDTSRRGS